MAHTQRPRRTKSSGSYLRVRFEKRMACLKKKAAELSTLCGIQTLLVCGGPDGRVLTWPEDEAEVRRIADRYRAAAAKDRVDVMGTPVFWRGRKEGEEVGGANGGALLSCSSPARDTPQHSGEAGWIVPYVSPGRRSLDPDSSGDCDFKPMCQQIPLLPPQPPACPAPISDCYMAEQQTSCSDDWDLSDLLRDGDLALPALTAEPIVNPWLNYEPAPVPSNFTAADPFLNYEPAQSMFNTDEQSADPWVDYEPAPPSMFGAEPWPYYQNGEIGLIDAEPSSCTAPAGPCFPASSSYVSAKSYSLMAPETIHQQGYYEEDDLDGYQCLIDNSGHPQRYHDCLDELSLIFRR